MKAARYTNFTQAISSRRPFEHGTISGCVCSPLVPPTLHDPPSSMMLWRPLSTTGLAIGKSAGVCLCVVSILDIQAKVRQNAGSIVRVRVSRRGHRSVCKRTVRNEDSWSPQQSRSHCTGWRSGRLRGRVRTIHEVDITISLVGCRFDA
jgi:hypothetical protein